MGKSTKIPWCDHTFSAVWGCRKTSIGCENCYAEALAKRWGRDCWGASPRRQMSDHYWKQPLKWNNWCKRMGLRHRVFAGSMFDAMEDHPDLEGPRERLWGLIEATPSLNWLLLTKRPENYERFLPAEWLADGLPFNVWPGTTVENQELLEPRLEPLGRVPAKYRWVSCEPMLGPIEFGLLATTKISWIITGSESGPKRRPFNRDWARAVRDECIEANIAYFHKQEVGEDGKKIETPPLDGKVWAQFPDDPAFDR